ncbi:PREDICTED: uncharacterized protein LOC106111356 [Papilio polytes]|uniref:uncharacterized protein LOC106111356 n=1 Tax=Papilio polytes TaxID=76194 RepID=UPI000676246E|nr:PREDICTED: uncharacterized protein LOC106111356 [Papilio polytes]
MVNYCCVQGCGRNSRLNKHLNFYNLPKERHRQIEWLKAAQREDLIKKNEDRIVSPRFCSRHFPPSSIKNRNLSPDAVPTLCLPGSWDDDDTESSPPVHIDIICDNCSKPITGFRYKCVNCDDYDLCQKCEMMEAHSHHFMLRMPKPLKYKLADNLIKKWRRLFKKAHVTPNCEDNLDISSDDEPIRKYANYDSGIELSEDVKLKIRKEIHRTLKLHPEDVQNKISKKRSNTEVEGFNKRMAIENLEDDGEYLIVSNNAPDVVFADVNEIKDEEIVVTNNELSESFASMLPNNDSPVVLVQIGDDISQLMILN